MRQLLELAPELPIIAVSAYENYLQTMKKLGAVQVLAKPFRMKKLIKAVRKASRQ